MQCGDDDGRLQNVNRPTLGNASYHLQFFSGQ